MEEGLPDGDRGGHDASCAAYQRAAPGVDLSNSNAGGEAGLGVGEGLGAVGATGDELGDHDQDMDPEENEDQGNNDEAESGDDSEEDSGEQEASPQEMELSGEEQESGDTEAAEADMEDFADQDMSEDTEEPGESDRPDLPASNRPETDYKVFTTQFDETVTAEDLCDIAELDRLRRACERAGLEMPRVAERVNLPRTGASEGVLPEGAARDNLRRIRDRTSSGRRGRRAR